MQDIWIVRLPGHMKSHVEAIARQQHRTGAEQVRWLVERALATEAISRSPQRATA